MSDSFFERPILNSPYACPARHWELDAGRPADQPDHRDAPALRADYAGSEAAEAAARRRARRNWVSAAGTACRPPSRNTTRPRSSTRSAATSQPGATCRTPTNGGSRRRPRGCSSTGGIINSRASGRSSARSRPSRPRSGWPRSPRTCGAAAPSSGTHLRGANEQANPELLRIALKMATGAGKTTVMAMLIAWQTVNAVRHPGSKQFSPRLPDRHARASRSRTGCACCCRTTRTAITATASSCRPTCSATSTAPRSSSPTTTPSSRRETHGRIARPARALLQGRGAATLNTIETEGQMLQRACGELMGLKNIVVLNDEAHHCYREKPAGRRRRGAQRRGQGGGQEEQRGGAAVDLGHRGRQAQARPRAPSTICRRRRSSCAARAMPRARCSPGRSATSR